MQSKENRNTTHGLIGLAFNLKENGGFVLDVREGQERIVGGIIPCPMGKGYTVCPFVKKSIVFDTFVPETVRTPKRMQDWILYHAVSWNNIRRYTLFNPLIGIAMLIGFPRILYLLKDNRTQAAFLQVAFAYVLTYYPAAEPDHIFTIGTRVVAGICTIWGLVNVVNIFRDHFLN